MQRKPSKKEVTQMYGRSIKPGHEKDYDDWLRRYLAIERNVPGYLGTTIIMPGGSESNVRYIIHRFSNKDAWMSGKSLNNPSRC